MNTNATEKTNTIAKPFTMAREELLQKLVNAVNESGLPIYVTEYIVRDFYNMVTQTVQQTAEKEKQEYEQQLKGTSDDT